MKNPTSFMVPSVFLLTCIMLSFTVSLNCQTLTEKSAEKIVSGSSKILLDERNKEIRFVQLKPEAIIDTNGQLMWLQKMLKFSPEHSLRRISVTTDKHSATHTKFQIRYKGLPVEGSVYSVHSKKGKTYAAHGNFKTGQELDIKPQITEKNAFDLALKYIGASKYKWEETHSNRPLGKVVIWPSEDQYILAYKFDIYAIDPLSRQYVYIDAKKGSVLKAINRIHVTNETGTAETMYSGTVNITTDLYEGAYRLRETSRGSGVETYDLNNNYSQSYAVDFTDTDNYWDITANYDNAAFDAHFGAEATYDYFHDRFGRNSYDDMGSKIVSYVHYGTGYVNAFWDGQSMTYGDGDGVNYLPLTPIEVVAHELTHGVTEYAAGLIYENESGALNESFSDIFGIVIDFEVNPLTANYLMGDAMSVSGTPFRSMQNPNAYQCPDTYLGSYWDPWQEVHRNSGVMNFWFYLLSEGGSGINDIGNHYSVIGIGRDKAAQIAYHSLTTYLLPTSDYADARFYSVQSAIDLFGECSDEVTSVTSAWYAVGVGEAFDGSVISAFSTSTTNVCEVPASVYFYNHSQNASSYIWNFGDGHTDAGENPVHLYEHAGNYTVSLISAGTAACASSDTVVVENQIVITDGVGPGVPSCVPLTLHPGTDGIFRFKLNTINKTSGGSVDNYQDYTCTDLTNVVEGKLYDLEVQVGNSIENIAVWLDGNNDNEFAQDEVLFRKNRVSKLCSTRIAIPEVAVHDIPLRLRVISDGDGNSLDDACNDIQIGQAEDYALIIAHNTEAPEAAFFCSRENARTGDSLQFTDQSQNLPSSWQWSFPGGEPSVSTEQNPKIAYLLPGVYDVMLIVQNAYGSDTIVRNQYLNVTNMPPAGLRATISDADMGAVKLSWFSTEEDIIFEDFNDGEAQNFVFYNDYTFVEDSNLIARSSGNNEWAETYYDEDFSDFTVEFKARKTEGDIHASIGTFFRSNGLMNNDDISGYVFCYTVSGYYSVFKMVSGSATALISWSTTNAINTALGTWNVVTIAAQGNNVKFFMNGIYLDQINDAEYTSGRLNFGCYMPTGYNNNTTWDDISILPQNGVVPVNSQMVQAINNKVAGMGTVNCPPVKEVKFNKVDVQGILGQHSGIAGGSFLYYNIYHNLSLIDSTTVTEYYDTLKTYGVHEYSVTAQYADGESEAAGPASVIWIEPNAGESCENALNLATLQSPYQGTTSEYVTDFHFCGMGSSPDRIFYIDMSPGDILAIGQTQNHYDSYHSLRTGGSCPGDQEIICVDDPDEQMHTYTNNSDSVLRIYWIQAGYSSGYGDFTLEWHLLHVSCPAPRYLKATDIEYDNATIHWEPGNEENEWELEWGESGFARGTGTTVKKIQVDSLFIEHLKSGTSYQVYARAICDSSDQSEWSGPVSFTTRYLQEPLNFKAEVIDFEKGAVSLSWESAGTGIYMDFNDTSNYGWIPITGTWLTKDQKYAGYGDSLYFISTSAHENPFDAYALEGEITATSTSSGYLGFIFNGDPASIDYNGDWTNGYMFYYTIEGVWNLYKVHDSWFTVLDNGYSLNIHPGIGATNRLKVVYRNGYIDCYANGVLLGSVYDSTYATGMIGLHSHNASAEKSEFDNISLRPVSDYYTFGKSGFADREVFRFNYHKNSKYQIHFEKAPQLNTIKNPPAASMDLVFYNIYRNNELIDTTSTVNYNDTLSIYGEYIYSVSAQYPQGESKATDTAKIGWYGNPLITVDPMSFDETLFRGDSVTRNITISNNGNGLLVFDMGTFQNTYRVKTINRESFDIHGTSGKNSMDESILPVISNSVIRKGIVNKNVLLFRDQLAWGFNVNQPLLESMGATVSTVSSNQMGTIDLSDYSLIIMESQQPSSFYTSFEANLGRFETFLNSGGIIEFHCASYGYERIQNLTFPGGMQTLSWSALYSENRVVDRDHPISTGLDTILHGNYASHEAFEYIPSHARIITENSDGQPTTVEYQVGGGWIIVTGMTWEYGYANSHNYANMLSNALQYSLNKVSDEWLKMSETSDTLHQGESVSIDVFFNSKNLDARTYCDTLVIKSTAVNTTKLNIPVSLHVILNDSLALVELFNNTNGPQWFNHSGWLEGPLNTWYGVTVENKDVTGLDLSANNLNGTLPFELGSLIHLDHLVLPNNNIYGTIPEELGYLAGLKHMDISNNMLSGTLPSSLGNLNMLEEMLLNNNQISGMMPASFNKLSNLQQLALGNNQITGISPGALAGLSQLRILTLNGNQIQGSVPEEISTLTNLQVLDVSDNQLTGFPILTHSSLLQLHIERNYLTFEDIEPNMGVASDNFCYWPQANVGSPNYISLLTLENTSFFSNVQGIHNRYQWYKNGEKIPGAEQDTLTITSAALSDAGIYTCRITNTVAVDLTLYSCEFNLYIIQGPHFRPVTQQYGYDYMNFYIYSAKIEGLHLQPGDEIGIYDGNTCVGSAILSYVIDGGYYLPIYTSKDDPGTPEIDGYIAGHRASYRLWKKDTDTEFSTVRATYEYGNGIFEAGDFVTVHLGGVYPVNQTISLIDGWNIFSLHAEPINKDMKALVQPLIDNGTLVKVQDETGAALEYVFPHGWVNDIGNCKIDQGYKIKVRMDVRFDVTGFPVNVPCTFDLNEGWNIIGYPVPDAQNALGALDQLIRNGTLVKVQSEDGKSIEYIDNLGWVDNIGTLEPGKGYKIKVKEDEELVISGQNNETSVEAISMHYDSNTEHFQPVYWDNGYDQMNLYISQARLNDQPLSAGDEIAVFDGEICAGKTTITESAKWIPIILYMDDPTTAGIEGFVKGHPIQFKIWSYANDVEAEADEINYLSGYDAYFEAYGTAVAEIEASATTVDPCSTETTVNVYPNPFVDNMYTDIYCNNPEKVTLRYFNVLGEEVYSQMIQTSSGTNVIGWNGMQYNGEEAPGGIYIIRITNENLSINKTYEMVKY